MADTRTQIVEQAFLLFLQKGFKRVKLSDIEKVAGITKGTFYYHFGRKEEVLQEGLSAYYVRINRQRTEEFYRIATLREYIDLTIRKLEGLRDYTARPFGCEIPEVLCLSLVAEAVPLFPELKKVVIVSKTERLVKLEQLISDAKKREELRNDVDTSILAKNILNIGAGVINYLLTGQDIPYAISSMRSQYEQLYGLVCTG